MKVTIITPAKETLTITDITMSTMFPNDNGTKGTTWTQQWKPANFDVVTDTVTYFTNSEGKGMYVMREDGPKNQKGLEKTKITGNNLRKRAWSLVELYMDTLARSYPDGWERFDITITD